jgi:hypothetical protein
MMNKTEAYAIRFARLCREHNLEPCSLGKLCSMARLAFSAGERHYKLATDHSQRALDLAMTRFEETAHDMGFSVKWPGIVPTGLWPILNKNGEEIHLPPSV